MMKILVFEEHPSTADKKVKANIYDTPLSRWREKPSFSLFLLVKSKIEQERDKNIISVSIEVTSS